MRKLSLPGRSGAALLLLCAAPCGFAGTRFEPRPMTRGDVPPGKGQCDIRLRVDGQVEVSVRGDVVSVRTIAGTDARDDGSECNGPLPGRDIAGFHFAVVESRDEMRLVAEPSRRNGFTAIVSIRDPSSGEGRYHFRLSWAINTGDFDRPLSRRPQDIEMPPAPLGMGWNSAVSFKGAGRGRAAWNDAGETRLGLLTIDVDRGGKLMAWFRTEGPGRPLAFTGQVLSTEGGRWKADVVTEDHRLRGPMWITMDGRQRVTLVTLDATDGQDRLRLSWDRR